MGKKSVVDSTILESLLGNVDLASKVEAVLPSHKAEDLREMIFELLNIALHVQHKQDLDKLVEFIIIDIIYNVF